MTLAKNAFPHRYAFLRHREQRGSIGSLVAHAFLPAVREAPIPWPPVFVITLSIERAFARDRDVLLFEGVDKRRVVEQLDAFPTREDDGHVVFRVLAELDRRPFRYFEIDIALQVNGAGEIRALWNDNSATTRFRTLIDRATESSSAIRVSITFGAEAVQIKSSLWKTRWLDPLENRRHHRFPGILGGRNQTRRESQSRGAEEEVSDEIATCRHFLLRKTFHAKAQRCKVNSGSLCVLCAF